MSMNTFEKAKILFNQYLTFFSVLAFRTVTIREGREVEAAGVNSKNELIWNPDFFGGNHKFLAFVLAHEVCHVFLRHHQRMADKIIDKKRQRSEHHIINIAMDCVANRMLIKSIKESGAANFFDWTQSFTFDVLAKEIGKPIPPVIEAGSWEMVYDWIKQNMTPPPSGGGESGEGADDGGEDAPFQGYKPDVDPHRGTPEKEQAMREAEVAAANIAAKANGKIPGHIAVILDKRKEEEIDFATKLLSYFTAKDRQYDNWLRPNRRYLSTLGLMPTKDGRRAGVIVVAVDTSGSVSDELVRRFLAQVEAICDQCKPEELYVVQCDSVIQDVIVKSEGDYCLREVVVKGRGGTDFRPVMKYVCNMDVQPDALVYLTDMWGPFGDDPGVPVLWCDFDGSCDSAPPYGERIVVRGKV